jgi:hypothetical protein
MKADKPTPRCPGCGMPMRFVRSVANFGALDAIYVYECKACGTGFIADPKYEVLELAAL